MPDHYRLLKYYFRLQRNKSCAMSDFDDRSGTIPCKTCWGQWWQTIEEVFAEINVPQGTRGKEIRCQITPSKISVALKEKIIVEGEFPEPVKADDSVWTLEDRKMVRVCLIKGHATAANCWKSLLRNQYEADPFTFNEMEKKLTLQRFQMENPGMDFSGASMSGNYHGGGPDLPVS